MSKTMEDVLDEHGVFEFDDESRLYRCRCGVWMADEDVAAHQAAALTAAGFGPVQAVRAEAWDEGFEMGEDYGEWSGAPVRNQPSRINPYRTEASS